ncbi:MAG: hypothetical protein EBZ27_12850 [Rhodobacteraceae bacterium]|nr:hypothetical protein [Paracoccaceae bacterium]
MNVRIGPNIAILCQRPDLLAGQVEGFIPLPRLLLLQVLLLLLRLLLSDFDRKLVCKDYQ